MGVLALIGFSTKKDKSTLSPSAIHSTEPATLVFKRLVFLGNKLFGASMKFNEKKYKVMHIDNRKDLKLLIY